jgi:short-subunit dehydrogenase
MRKLLVVTGGSRGIGHAIIEKFMANDFDVITCARSRDDLTASKSQLTSQFPGSSFEFQTADVSSKEEAIRFTDYVKNFARVPDVLVNNAGYFIPGQISTEEDGTLESMINANLYSAYHVTRGLVGMMKEKKAGHIFNMCSVASFMAYPNGGSYAISKFALLGFSKSLREELKPHQVKVTAVMPGATKTRSWDGVGLPDDRFISSQDLAETIYSAWSLSSRSVVEEIIIRPHLGDI